MIKLLKIDFRITDLLCLSGFIEIIPGVFGFFLGLTENYQPFLRNSGKYRPFLTTGRLSGAIFSCPWRDLGIARGSQFADGYLL